MKIQMKLNTGLKLTGGWNQRICESAGDVITLVNDVLFSYKLKLQAKHTFTKNRSLNMFGQV